MLGSHAGSTEDRKWYAYSLWRSLFFGFGMTRDYVCKDHAVFVGNLYKGEAHPTVAAGFLHTIEIRPDDLPLNENRLSFRYIDDHLKDFTLV